MFGNTHPLSFGQSLEYLDEHLEQRLLCQSSAAGITCRGAIMIGTHHFAPSESGQLQEQT